jgi:hypothetical protein
VPVRDGVGARVFAACDVEGNDQAAGQPEQQKRRQAARLAQTDQQRRSGYGDQLVLP